MSLFTDVFGEFLENTVKVEPAEGSNAWGTVKADPVEVEDCMVQEVTKRLAVGSSGTVQQSTCQVYHDLDGTEELFVVNTEITLPSGRKSKVVQVDVMRLTGFPSHVVAYLE